MSWNKGSTYDKALYEEHAKDFVAATNAMSDILTRYTPDVGISALAYMVACVLITHADEEFNKLVKAYVKKIKVDVLEKLKNSDHEMLDAITKELHKKVRR